MAKYFIYCCFCSVIYNRIVSVGDYMMSSISLSSLKRGRIWKFWLEFLRDFKIFISCHFVAVLQRGRLKCLHNFISTLQRVANEMQIGSGKFWNGCTKYWHCCIPSLFRSHYDVTKLFLISRNKSRTEYVLHSSQIMLLVKRRVKNI